MKKVFSTANHEEIPFQVDEKEYVLIRASGKATRIYREASLSGAEMDYDTSDEEKKAKRITVRKLQAIASVESVLVAECCFSLPGRIPVPREVIEDWPGEIQKWAFDEVKRISPWLDEKPEDLDALRKQRDALDARLKKLEASDPKS